MRTTAFPAARINRLRTLAAEARRVPEEPPDGWSKSVADPAAVVAVFPPLHVRPGYVLRAYQFRSGGNGNGFVWAMPADSPFPAPDDCPRLTDQFLNPPKPESALNDYMGCISGDETPWSYICASVLKRELGEFGALWHGCSWGTHTILGRDPFGSRPSPELPESVAALEEWLWSEPCPDQWRPRVMHDESGTVMVRFLTYSALGEQRIVRHEDTYGAGSYRCESQDKVLATAPGGFVF